MGDSAIAANMFRGVLELDTNHFVNRTGGSITAGNVLALDLTASDGDVTDITSFNTSDEKDEVHPLANVINVASTHMSGWIFCVALENAADDEIFEGALQGVIQVELDNTVSDGDAIMPTTGATDAVTLTDGNAAIGVALEAGPSSGTSNGLAAFNGRCLGGAAGSANA